MCGRESAHLCTLPPRGLWGLTWAHGFRAKQGPDKVCMAHPSCGGRRTYLLLAGLLPSSHTGDPRGTALENLTRHPRLTFSFHTLEAHTLVLLTSIWDPFPAGHTPHTNGCSQLAV